MRRWGQIGPAYRFDVLSVLPSWWTTLADRGLPHNHHKPRLAGNKLGGSV